jgi:hypothetical protein
MGQSWYFKIQYRTAPTAYPPRARAPPRAHDLIFGGGEKGKKKKFSKHLIFNTDCSQSMGLQSVLKLVKIRGETSQLFALQASPYNDPNSG